MSNLEFFIICLILAVLIVWVAIPARKVRRLDREHKEEMVERAERDLIHDSHLPVTRPGWDFPTWQVHERPFDWRIDA